MNPTFVSRMLQSLAESTSGFSTGRRSPEAAGGTCVHSLRSSLLKQEEDEDDGEKALALSGQRKRGRGGGDCFCWHLATEVKQQASICLQNLHFSSTKFSFQSPDRKRCVRACVRLRVPTSRVRSWTGTPEPGRLLACPHVALSRGTRRSACLPRERTWKEKPAFWCAGFSLRVVSLLAEEAQITTWVLFLFFI